MCPDRRIGSADTKGFAGVALMRMPCLCADPGLLQGENWTCVSGRGGNG